MTGPPQAPGTRRPARRPGDTAVPEPRALPEVVRFDPARRSVIERSLRRGQLRRVRQGVYLPAVVDDGGPALRRQRRVLEKAAAVAATLRSDVVFSHETAALIHGLALYRLADEVHVTQRTKPRVRKRWDPDLRRHAVPLPDRDRTVVRGRAVTTIERTLVDCARWLPGPQALVIADSALRAGADLRRVGRILAEAAGRPGVRQARWVVDLADARAESPGESLVRWHLLDHGLAAPDLAVPVATRRGTSWIDLGWPDLRVGIEFDGAVKYSGGDYGDPHERLVAEKMRHDALVEAGWFILRVTWADLGDPAALVGRVRTALAEAGRRRRLVSAK